MAPFRLPRTGWCLIALLVAVLGTARETHALSYVALGDSLAVGAGDAGGGGYVARYHDHLAADLLTPVSLQNLAVGGTTSQDLLTTLTSDGAVRAAIAAADVVTFDIGGNDVLIALFAFAGGTCGGADGQDCLRVAVSEFETNWPAILAELRTLNPGALMRTMTYYNPVIVDLAPGDGTAVAMHPYIDAVNATIRSATPAFGIGIADAALAFNGASGKENPIPKGYLDTDHIHPSPLGYDVLDDGFHALGYEPIPGTLVRIPSSLALRDDATAPLDPAKRRLSLTASTKKGPPGNRIVAPRPGGPQDPRTAGAEILVYNATGATSDRAVIALPAAGWSLAGATYRYKGTDAVTQVQLAPDKLKLKGKGAAIDYSLDEPTQGSVALRLTFGGGSLCAAASAATSGNPPSTAKSDQPGKFVGVKKAPAPAACPPDWALATPTPMATPTPTITATPGPPPTCSSGSCGACGSCGDGFCAIEAAPPGCTHTGTGNVCFSNSQCNGPCTSDADCGPTEACVHTGFPLSSCCGVCP